MQKKKRFLSVPKDLSEHEKIHLGGNLYKNGASVDLWDITESSMDDKSIETIHGDIIKPKFSINDTAKVLQEIVKIYALLPAEINGKWQMGYIVTDQNGDKHSFIETQLKTEQ